MKDKLMDIETTINTKNKQSTKRVVISKNKKKNVNKINIVKNEIVVMLAAASFYIDNILASLLLIFMCMLFVNVTIEHRKEKIEEYFEDEKENK